MRSFVALFVFALALWANLSPALADKRVALLIGNSNYAAASPLANPRNDVKLIKSALEAAGFDEVRVAFDLGQKPLLKALNAFADAAADADIAVLYYSGHGMEMGGVNYLIPVDATLATDTDVADETVTLERAMQALDGAKRLKLIILDACRVNPFLASIKSRSGRKAIGEKGLAPAEPSGPDTLIAFAAKAGTPAYDGEGANSPFAIALARRLGAPGDDVQIALRKVRDDVLAATHNRQEPFQYGSLSGSVIPLAKGAGGGADAQQAAFEAAMAADTVAALDAFLTKYPDGGLAQVARRERERLAQVAAIVPKPIPTPAAPCGGVTSVSLASRGVGVLTDNELCALRRGDVFKECADCPEMVVVPAGSFTMGSPDDEPERYTNEGPQHEVRIARAFAVGKFHVTKDEFAAFVKDTGYDAGSKCWYFGNGKFGEGRSWRDPGFAQTGSHPAVCVNWDDAQAYVKWLKDKTGQSYRLLSESEWEYSARAGTTTAYFWGAVVGKNNANCDGCGSRWDNKQTSPVGSFSANEFGLYDMHGNAWQWVEDCYRDSYAGAPRDGSPITSGECGRRVRRGGSWLSFPEVLRAAFRRGDDPSNRKGLIGFRVARTLLP